MNGCTPLVHRSPTTKRHFSGVSIHGQQRGWLSWAELSLTTTHRNALDRIASYTKQPHSPTAQIWCLDAKGSKGEASKSAHLDSCQSAGGGFGQPVALGHLHFSHSHGGVVPCTLHVGGSSPRDLKPVFGIVQH